MPLFLFRLKRKSGAKREMQEGVKLSYEKQYSFLKFFLVLFLSRKRIGLSILPHSIDMHQQRRLVRSTDMPRCSWREKDFSLSQKTCP